MGVLRTTCLLLFVDRPMVTSSMAMRNEIVPGPVRGAKFASARTYTSFVAILEQKAAPFSAANGTDEFFFRVILSKAIVALSPARKTLLGEMANPPASLPTLPKMF